MWQVQRAALRKWCLKEGEAVPYLYESIPGREKTASAKVLLFRCEETRCGTGSTDQLIQQRVDGGLEENSNTGGVEE